ncbi:unnamed protein product, partial [Tuber melanosporum]
INECINERNHKLITESCLEHNDKEVRAALVLAYF